MILGIFFALLMGIGMPTQAQQSSHDQITQVYKLLSMAYEHQKVDILKSLYAEHAVYLEPNKKEGIQNYEEAMRGFQTMFEQAKGTDLDIDFKFDKRVIEGSFAYDAGYYKLMRTDEKDKKIESYGKFLIILKKGKDDIWQIQADSFNPSNKKAFEAARF